MRAILGLDTIEEAIKLCKENVKNLNKNIEKTKTEITVLESQKLELKPEPEIPVDYDSVMSRYSELKADYDKYLKAQDLTVKYETQKSLLEDKNKSLTSEKETETKLTDELKKIDASFSEFKDLDTQIKEKNDSIDILKKTLAEIEKNLDLYETYEENNKSIKLLNRQLSILTETINESEFKSTKDIDDKIDLVNSEIALYRIDIERYNDSKSELKSKIKSENEHIELVKLGQCPKCKQKVDGGQDSIVQSESDIKKWNQELLLLENKITDIKLSIEGKESIIKTYNENKTSLSVNLTKKENLEKDISEKESKLVKPDIDKEALIENQTKLKSDYDALDLYVVSLNLKKETRDRIQTDKIEKQAELKSCVNQIVKLESEISIATDLVKKLDEEKKDVQIGNFNITEYNEIDSKKQSYDLLVNNRDQIVQQNKEIQEQIDTRKTMLEEKTKQIQTSTEQIDIDQRSVKLMQGYISNQINKGLRKLVIIMNNFISSVHDTYEVKLENEDDIDIVYSVNAGKNWKLTHSSSGFEKLTLQGAWKVALSKLQNLGILFLDEPDGAAVDKNSIKLLDAFVNQGFEQIFIITLNPDTIEHLTNNYGAKTFMMSKGKLIE